MRSLTVLPCLVLMGALGCVTPLYATELDALDRIGAQVEKSPAVRAEFTQTRQMAALKRALVTTGRLVYSRKHGVLWEIEQPYRMTYVLGDEKIVEIGADGVRKERGVREVPDLAQVARVLGAMLGANTAALREYFDVALQGDTSMWSLELKPRQPQLAQALTGLQLSGSRFVETIRIKESGGDTTHIRLRHTQSVATPSDAELKLFGGESRGTSKP